MPKLYILAVVLTVVAAVLFGIITLLGAWIDGRRQALLNKGLHPTTTPEGNVVAREFEPPPVAPPSPER